MMERVSSFGEDIHIEQMYNGIYVEAELGSGVNVLCSESGTGKTLFMRAVELYCLTNEIKHVFFNYRNAKYDEEILIEICEDKDVIIIDDADLFPINKLVVGIKAANPIILISLKDSTKINESDNKEFLVHYSNGKVYLEEI